MPDNAKQLPHPIRVELVCGVVLEDVREFWDMGTAHAVSLGQPAYLDCGPHGGARTRIKRVLCSEPGCRGGWAIPGWCYVHTPEDAWQRKPRCEALGHHWSDTTGRCVYCDAPSTEKRAKPRGPIQPDPAVQARRHSAQVLEAEPTRVAAARCEGCGAMVDAQGYGCRCN